jgi:hypothetical protein
MADTALADARKGETTARVWTFKADGVAINLTGATIIKMYYEYTDPGRSTTDWICVTTLDTGPMLVVTTAASGICTFTPTEDFWKEGSYRIYFFVDHTTNYSLPNTTYYTVKVTEGA